MKTDVKEKQQPRQKHQSLSSDSEIEKKVEYLLRGKLSKPSSSTRKGLPISPTVLSGMFTFIDGLIIVSSGLLTYSTIFNQSIFVSNTCMFAVIFIWLTSFLIGQYSEIYTFPALLNPLKNAPNLTVVFGVSFLLLLAAAFSLDVSEGFSRLWIYSFAIASLSLVVFFRLIGYFSIVTLARNGYCRRKVAIIGANQQTEQLLKQLDIEQPKISQIIGIFDDRLERVEPSIGNIPVLGNVSDLINYARTNPVHDIFIALPWHADKRQMEIIETVKQLPIRVHLVTDMIGFRFSQTPSPNHFGNIPIISVLDSPLSGFKIALKTIEDRILGFFLLILFSPVLLIVAAAISLESKGPIFFKQQRFGYNNRIFEIYKFRSMYVDAENKQVTSQATKGDPRITKVGKFIRKTSFDELPQLINVFLGNMSLVGPRPHAVDHNELYSALIVDYFSRHKVKPGITGWAQINGFRGETDTLDKMESRVEYDIYYVENWSLFFDFKILAKTAFVGFVNKNAY